ncbi:MAG: rhomboid family intramembrane serine protease [Alphaproteobacteria bacterium]|nr:rhomboid family intramembrane serine protease [Alphaproteobacteria bacterium]
MAGAPPPPAAAGAVPVWEDLERHAHVAPPRLLQDGVCVPVDLTVLEEEIRQGQAPENAWLHHPAWTGAQFVRVDEVAQLADAFQSPAARLVARLRSRCIPRAAIALTATVFAFGVLQLVARAGLLGDDASQAVTAFFTHGRVGYDELLLAGEWWSPWLSQLTHGGAWHLIANLVVLSFMAWRVERALGAGSLALVAASSMTVGTLAIAWLDDLPAVGSSVVAYGLWGAVLAVGFRFGDALQHLRVRGRYGFGTLPLFAVLFASSLGQPATTHVGHFFGLVGGGLAAMVVAAETLEPARSTRRAALGNAALAVFVALVPVLVQAAVGRSPVLLAGRRVPIDVPSSGASLSLPTRMADHEVRLLGMPAWTTSASSEAALFVGLVDVRADADLTEALVEQWADATLMSVQVDADTPICPPAWAEQGWQCLRLVLTDPDSGELVDHVVEHLFIRGRTVLRVGWRAGQPTAEPRREALYRHLLASLQVAEPPSLVDAREKLARNPDSPRMQYELARQLARLASTHGSPPWGEADGMLGDLSAREDAWAWDAARLRLELWAQAAESQRTDFRGGGQALADAQDWTRTWLSRAPPLDSGIHRPGVRVLAATGDCEGARAHLAELSRHDAASELIGTLSGDVARLCGAGR